MNVNAIRRPQLWMTFNAAAPEGGGYWLAQGGAKQNPGDMDEEARQAPYEAALPSMEDRRGSANLIVARNRFNARCP